MCAFFSKCWIFPFFWKLFSSDPYMPVRTVLALRFQNMKHGGPRNVPGLPVELACDQASDVGSYSIFSYENPRNKY